MKSHELAKLLLSKPNVEILLQKDEEGNGYTEMRGVDFNVICVYEDYEYSIYDPTWDAEQAGLDEEEWEALKQEHVDKNAILYP